jgi:hypothetical protein
MSVISEADQERFWSRVNKTDGCWLWIGRAADGYGHITIAGGVRKAHRVSWTLANGGIFPARHLFVCHKCDNPMCVRPDHLFLGTVQDNVKDMIQKQRQRGGANQPFHAPRRVKYCITYNPAKNEWGAWACALYLGSYRNVDDAAMILRYVAKGGNEEISAKVAYLAIKAGVQLSALSPQ